MVSLYITNRITICYEETKMVSVDRTSFCFPKGESMNLTATQIRYLLAIYHLSKNGIVRSSEIADSLNVSRPSVHRMVEQLFVMNLIMKEKYSSIGLTEKGYNMAEQYEEGLYHISGFLSNNLNLSNDTAENGALSILVELDDTMLKELCIRMSEM